MIPKGWSEENFTEFATVNPRRSVPKGEVIRFVEMAAVSETAASVSHLLEREFKGSGSKFQNGDTLFARITPCAENGKTAFVSFLDQDECAAGSTELIVLAPDPQKCFPKFLYFLARWERIRSHAISNMEGTSGRQRVPARVFSELVLSLPPLHEQKRIAEILTSVDDAIQATEKVIEQTKKVKQGLLQELLTRGIGHSKFKKTKIGEIPESWEVVKLGELFDLVERPIDMHDNDKYQLVTVKRRFGGVVERSVLKGEQIKVKSQFSLKAGDFLISKRQIVHGACEVVPASLENAIVSNEYNVLRPRNMLHLDFFRWLCRRPFMMEYFLICSIGVHIEKMLFKINDWNRQLVPLPPLTEQRYISEKLTFVDANISNYENDLESLFKIKSGLMQDLLTGRVRVGGTA
ncbi:MAG: restriction endonuclease subunit S [Deltaproteobacteria bacterium]|nr:restriction endonuclease subunit S [Deltaproteobacteria bacterium]